MIRRGRLVLVNGGQEPQTNLSDHQAQVHSDQIVLLMARQEAGPCERRQNSKDAFSNDAEMRVGNNSWQPRNLTGKRHNDSRNKSQLALSHGVLWRGSCFWWRWLWWVRTNQASHRFMQQRFWVLTIPCSELSLNMSTWLPETRSKGGSSHHTPSHMMGGGEGKDKDSQCGYIISPSWFYTSEWGFHASDRQGLK
jgi:hypothetical protein